MKILIIHAHNEPRSFSAAMKDLAVDALRGAGHEVAVSDLYAMRFNPTTDAANFRQRTNPDYLAYALEQRHAERNNTLAPDIAADLDKIRWADFLLFNFPIYWFDMSAIMKGWIDRVFVSGYCYGGVRIDGRGGCKEKTAMLAVSLGGREHMFGLARSTANWMPCCA
jgi:NAD(P)H dehydrogenase (quinone)